MENVRYATNDDTVGFINQMKNRNTSRKTGYDLSHSKLWFLKTISSHNRL